MLEPSNKSAYIIIISMHSIGPYIVAMAVSSEPPVNLSPISSITASTDLSESGPRCRAKPCPRGLQVLFVVETVPLRLERND